MTLGLDFWTAAALLCLVFGVIAWAGDRTTNHRHDGDTPQLWREHNKDEQSAERTRQECKCHPGDDDSGHCIDWRQA